MEKRWVVRWNGTDPLLDRSEVVLLLPAVWGSERVAQHLESVYVAMTWLDSDKWNWSKNRRDFRLRPCLQFAHYSIFCGDNPWLEARHESIEWPISGVDQD